LHPSCSIDVDAPDTDAKFLEGSIDAGFEDQKGMEDTEGFSLVILARRRSGQILAQRSNGWPSSMVQPPSPPNYRSDKVHQLARAPEGQCLDDPELITMRLSRQHSHTASLK